MKKLLILLGGCLYMLSGFSSSESPKLNPGRVLLSVLRQGDYAHAGDQEAVDLVLQKALDLAPTVQEGPALDVGSGLGKTAYDLFQAGFPFVFGIDLDEGAVEYAKVRYPDVSFLKGDAKKLREHFPSETFSFLSLFNVFYAIAEKREVLKELFEIARPGALLVLYDYSSMRGSLEIQDLAGKPMHPIQVEPLTEDLLASGWTLLEVEDFSKRYIKWYEELLDKLSQQRPALSEKYPEEVLQQVEKTFSYLLDLLKKEQLGAVAIYARK